MFIVKGTTLIDLSVLIAIVISMSHVDVYEVGWANTESIVAETNQELTHIFC